MAIRVCPHCQLPFVQQRDEEVCPNCMSEGENQFRIIKEYLYAHPGASATELVQELDVTIRQIQHYLREDRLHVVGEGFTGLKCDLCGKAIQTGRYCEHCEKDAAAKKKRDFQKAALNALQAMKAENSPEKAEDKKKQSKKGSGLRFRNR